MGPYTDAVYTAEQQARLGVDEYGKTTDTATPTNGTPPAVVGGQGGIGPAWTRGEMERPAGTKDMGPYSIAVYTAEQQARLGVDEYGKTTDTATPTNGTPPAFSLP